MLTRSIGGIQVSPIGLGCFPLTGGYGQVDEISARRVITTAIELGLNLFDTADVYAFGENERLLGSALTGHREQAVITTKFGWRWDGTTTILDSSPAYVREACQASLRRLQTDYIDIYIQHRVDPATPIEEVIGELSQLQSEGKIRSFGLSEASANTLLTAHRTAPVATLQTEYSLWSRDAERELLPLCVRLGVTFMAYSPLGRGFLAGSVRAVDDLAPGDLRRAHPRFEEGRLELNLSLVQELVEVAAQLGCSPSQLALRWVLAQHWPIVPIPGTRRMDHLVDNVQSLQGELDAATLVRLTQIFDAARVSGHDSRTRT